MICTCCEEDKEAEEFSPGRKQCRACEARKRRARYAADPETHRARSKANRRAQKTRINSVNREYRRQNPDRVREWQRRSKRRANGWEPGQWEAAMEAQGGICAVPGCGRTAEVADHCHESGRARAALCSGCNKALGLIDDNPVRAEGLAEYLRAHAREVA